MEQFDLCDNLRKGEIYEKFFKSTICWAILYVKL